MGGARCGLRKLFCQPLRELAAGLLAVVVNQRDGPGRVACANGVGDGLVFVPDRIALLGRLQHGAHHPAQVPPVQVGALLDQRVLRGGVNRVVEGQVGFDHRLDVVAPGGCAALRD